MTALALVFCLLTRAQAEQATVINSGFEGSQTWSVSSYPIHTLPTPPVGTVRIDHEISHSGKQSLCITSPHPGYMVRVETPVKDIETETLYRVSMYVRSDKSIPEPALGLQVVFRTPGNDSSVVFAPGQRGAEIVWVNALMGLQKEPQADGWTRWSGNIYVPRNTSDCKLRFAIKYAVGRVWLDDVQVETVKKTTSLERDVWTWWLPGCKTGNAPIKDFIRHKEANDGIYKMAKRYNELLMASAIAEDKLRHVERCLAFAGKSDAGDLREKFADCEKRLQDVYLAYGRAFQAEVKDISPDFTSAAGALAQAIASLEKACDQRLDTIRRGRQFTLPDKLGRQAPSIPPFNSNGKMNRLLFGGRTESWYFEFAKLMGLEFNGALSAYPKAHTENNIDFSGVTELTDLFAAAGYRGTYVQCYGFGLPSVTYAPDWFVEKHKSEPDLIYVSYDEQKGGFYGANVKPGKTKPLNHLNPVVQNYVRDYLEKFSDFCHKDKRILFYEISQEAKRTFATPKGTRETGYGPSGQKAFRTYLEGRYRDIATLNRIWGTNYASFAAIEPPPDYNVVPREGLATPLEAEFEAFREQAFEDYIRLTYQALKKGSPEKPVTARLSSLLTPRNTFINGARLFEMLDSISFHGSYPWMQMNNMYLNTLNRFAGKSLCYLEPGWFAGEDEFRWSEEIAMRRAREKDLIQSCIWGRTMQVIWGGSWSTADYIGEYGRSTWLDPRYDLTTMCYHAPGVRTAKNRLEMVDWVLTHSQIAKSRIAMIAPSATLRNCLGRKEETDVALHEMLGIHQLLYPKNLFYELMPEEYFEEGKARLEDFAVVILPRATYLSACLQKKLAAFVIWGGTLVACGRPGVVSEIGRPCNILAEALGQGNDDALWTRLEKAWAVNDQKADPGEKSLLEVSAVGKGKIVAFAGLAHLGFGAASGRLVQLMEEQAGRAAWSEHDRIETVLRIAENGGRYVFLLNHDVDKAVTDTVYVAEPAAEAVDVIVSGGFPVPIRSTNKGSAFDVRLGPGEFTVIYLGK